MDNGTKAVIDFLGRYPKSAGAAAGGGLGVCTNIMTNHWVGAPSWFLDGVFYIGLFLFLVPLPTIYLWTRGPYHGDKNIIRAAPVLLYWALMFFLVHTADRSWGSAPQADMSLCLINAEQPHLVAFNLSDQVTAENSNLSAQLYDLDSPTSDTVLNLISGGVPALRPRAVTIPFDLSSSVPRDHRIAGSLGITCPRCKTGRTFWIYFKAGSGGWYSKKKDVTDGGAVVLTTWATPNEKKLSIASGLSQILDSIQIEERVAIRTVGTDLVVSKTDTHRFTSLDCLSDPK